MTPSGCWFAVWVAMVHSWWWYQMTVYLHRCSGMLCGIVWGEPLHNLRTGSGAFQAKHRCDRGYTSQPQMRWKHTWSRMPAFPEVPNSCVVGIRSIELNLGVVGKAKRRWIQNSACALIGKQTTVTFPRSEVTAQVSWTERRSSRPSLSYSMFSPLFAHLVPRELAKRMYFNDRKKRGFSFGYTIVLRWG